MKQRTMRDRLSGLTFKFVDQEPDKRLGELILYVSERCGTDPFFGNTKLNKILFYSDMLTYANLGQPITGSEYMRLPNGPVPKHMKPVLEKMKARKDMVMVSRDFYRRTQHRVVPLREAKIDGLFTPTQIAWVERVIEALGHMSATQVSKRSHDRVWRIADDKKSIPYEAIYLSDQDATPDDEARAHELAEKYSWDV
ncbi:MAG: SocA family protein [Proteobacteria bacterium]|nr:SocA family protein [Pseudomonadota bacterium]